MFEIFKNAGKPENEPVAKGNNVVEETKRACVHSVAA